MRTLVEDTLKELEPEVKYTQQAVELCLGTIAQESAYGKYRKQIGGGPGLGIVQMEPETFNDCVDNYLAFRPKLADKIKEVSGVKYFNAQDVENNDKLAICMMRVKYMRDKVQIPTDLLGWAVYWKRVYNTFHGAGKETEFIHNYKFYVLKEPLV